MHITAADVVVLRDVERCSIVIKKQKIKKQNKLENNKKKK